MVFFMPTNWYEQQYWHTAQILRDSTDETGNIIPASKDAIVEIDKIVTPIFSSILDLYAIWRKCYPLVPNTFNDVNNEIP